MLNHQHPAVQTEVQVGLIVHFVREFMGYYVVLSSKSSVRFLGSSVRDDAVATLIAASKKLNSDPPELAPGRNSSPKIYMIFRVEFPS